MSKKYNIDDLFRKGANQRQFHPRESDWEAVARQLSTRRRAPAIWRWLVPLLAVIVVGTGALLYAQLGSHQSAAQPAGTLMKHNLGLSQSLAQMAPTSAGWSNLPEEKRATPAHTAASGQEYNTQTPGHFGNNSPKLSTRSKNAKPSVASQNVASIMKQSIQNRDSEQPASSDKDKPRSSWQPEYSKEQEHAIAYNGYYHLLNTLPVNSIAWHRPDPFSKCPDSTRQNVIMPQNHPTIGLRVKGGALLSSQFVGNEAVAELTIPIANRLHLAAGAGYWWRPIKGLNYTAAGHEYGFGRNNITINLEPLQVHYVSLPLKLSYQLSVRHRLVGGVEANLLATAYSRISETTTRPESNPDANTSNEWGYTEGFEKIHLNYLLGYEFRYSERWSLGLATRFGQGAVIKTDVFNKNELDNKHVSFYVQYHIW